MSRARSAGVREEPGPIDEAIVCADCPPRAGKDASYRIPDPRYDIATTSALCPYHLAVLKREKPLAWRDLREHPELPDPDDHVQEHALVERDDVPEEIVIDDVHYQRLGLDELGKAYFVAEEATTLRIVATDAEFDVIDAVRIPPDQLLGLLDHVRDEIGWRGLEGEWVDRAHADRGGGRDG